MRNAVLFVLGLAGLSAGVMTGFALAEAPADNPADTPADAPLDDPRRPPIDRPPVEPGLPNVPITRTCEEIEETARGLVAEAQTCTEDVGCEILMVEELVGPENCVGAFQCGVAVSADLDRAAFLEVAAPLVVEKLECGECAQAACMPPAELITECIVGRCEIYPRQQPPTRVPESP